MPTSNPNRPIEDYLETAGDNLSRALQAALKNPNDEKLAPASFFLVAAIDSCLPQEGLKEALVATTSVCPSYRVAGKSYKVAIYIIPDTPNTINGS